MYNAFLEKTEDTISSLQKYLKKNDQFRNAVHENLFKCEGSSVCFGEVIGASEGAPDRLQWRIIDHCVAVTRIYAIYEQFMHEMIREHLGLLQRSLTYEDLPRKIHELYRSGVAKILEQKDNPRFNQIEISSLIDEYNKALSGQPYQLEPLAMLMQEQNLRLKELHRLMANCGIDDLTAWIQRHRLVSQFFESADRLSASCESELSELIKYRNEAAHGSIDITDILHLNVLLEFCDFISMMCRVVSERVLSVGLHKLKTKNLASDRGKITELLYNDDIGVAVVSGKFQVGSTIYLSGTSYCLERTIISLQVDGVSVEGVDLDCSKELGIKFSAPIKKNSIVIMMD